MADVDSKLCRRCGEHKLTAAFAKNSTKHDGLQVWCRKCKVDVQRAHRKLPPKDPNAPPPPVPTHRVCSKCGCEKLLSEYGKASDEAFGHAHRCKACVSAYASERYLSVRKAKKFKIEVAEKHCPRCDETKTATAFVPSSHRSDGLSKFCQLCDSAVRREKGYYQKLKAERPEFVLERGREWRLKNLERARELDRAHAKLARKRKPEVFREIGARKRAELVQAKPAWADIKAIRAVYKEAQRLERLDGVKRHVDHIIPLRSKLVCGLHVEHNLQILTQSENSHKTNTFEVQ